MKTKICTRCNKDLLRENFYTYKAKNGKKYPLAMCKKCHLDWRRERYGHKKLEARDPLKPSWRDGLRKEVIAHLGGKCVQCGYDKDIRALQIDHVNGGGNKARKKHKSWSVMWREILDDKHEHKVQLLCANCNFIKRIENKEMIRSM